MAIVLCVLLWPERRPRAGADHVRTRGPGSGERAVIGADAGLAVADAAALLNWSL